MRTFSLSCLEKEKYDGAAVCVEPSVGLGGVTSNGTAFLVPIGTRLSERKQVFQSDGSYKFTSSKFCFDRKFVLLGTSHGEVLRAEFNGGHRMLFKITEAEKRASGEAIAFLAISKQHDMIAAATQR
jgi:hypothetical protein